MSQSSQDFEAHSSNHLGEYRNFWWNRDFLELIAKRWEFSNVRSVLDVGCGIGHWSRTLASVLNYKTEIYGIDSETRWITEARRLAVHSNLKQKFDYSVQKVECMNFEDNFFDMVTCQTLLIHVSDLEIAISEMLRVLKPDGLLVIAEPLNTFPSISCNSALPINMVDEFLASLKFSLICYRGKDALGEGCYSTLDTLPEILIKNGLKKICSFLSDKTLMLTPPYKSKEQQAWLDTMHGPTNENILIWPKEQTQRYYLAGGGDEKLFEYFWKQEIEANKQSIINIQNQKMTCIGANTICLISGRKNAN